MEEFTGQPIFNPTLFVDLRKRIREDDINKMKGSLLKLKREMKKASRKQMEEESKRVYGQPSVAPSQDENTAAFVDCKERVHR